jgi:CHRD domain
MLHLQDATTNDKWRMSAKVLGICGLLAASVAIAGCGGSSAPANSRARIKAQKPSVEYVVRMSGTSESPPTHGVGDAVIALHGKAHDICYRFAHMRGFTDASNARILRGATRETGTFVVSLATGPRLHHRGCLRMAATVMTAIAADPSAYYVEIRSVQYPRGLVRAQL